MDIQMPVLDGYGATALIRSMPEMNKQSIPIIALTAHASQAEAEKCINLGMNAYVTKPFNQQDLLQVINRLTAK
jgi:CheY-like chemotaxis protein